MVKTSSLLAELLSVDVFKVGEFVLKGNHLSPFYIDLRHIPYYPKILNGVVKEMHALINHMDLEMESVCGVPYNALPFAAVLSSRHEIPMLLQRKEAKTYGTKKLLEGIIVRGTRCLIIEDVVVSGASIKETADVLRGEGLVVTDCITILDRLQGGKENLSKFGIRLHSLFDINDILSLYCAFNEVKPSVIERVRQYLQVNICSLEAVPNPRCPFSQRTGHPILRRLFEVVERKKSNLCVAVDVSQSSELLRIVAQVAPHVCMLKMHGDHLLDFSDDVPTKLRALAAVHDFLILEDRKFCDIGDICNIMQWADVLVVHGTLSHESLESLKKASTGEKRACLLVTQTSSEGSLTNAHYSKVAESNSDFVIGFIGQDKILTCGDFVHVCPVENTVSEEDDSLHQQCSTPEDAVSKGADIVMVGKDICKSSDVAQAAVEYKKRAYNAYLMSCPQT